MQTLNNKGFLPICPDDQGHKGVNMDRTESKSDTPLTQWRSPSVRGYVYFIRGGDAIKIGYSVDPVMRLSQLQIGSSDALELLGAIEGTEQTESDLHEHFQDVQKLGEWFHADPDLLAFIAHATGKPTVQEPQPEPPRPELPAETRFLIARLINIRTEHDAESAIGNRCSLLVEQIENLACAHTDWQRANIRKSMLRTQSDLDRLTGTSQ